MEKVALLAFGGGLTSAIKKSCQHQGRDLFIIGFREFPADIKVDASIGLGQIGKLFQILKANKITKIMMAGYLTRPNLWQLRFDFTGLRVAFSCLSFLKRGDDALLRYIISVFEKRGIEVLSIADICHDLVMIAGFITKDHGDMDDMVTIKKGRDILTLLSGGDIGQSVAVSAQVVLAVEAIEGTDEMIKRVGSLAEYKIKALPSPILIKATKTQQIRTADLPVFGIKTLDNLIASGFKGAALEAGSVLLLDSERLIKKAKKHNFFIYGFDR